MPNWCENVLTIEGPKEQIKRFKNKAKSTKQIKPEGTETFEEYTLNEDFKLGSIIPAPEDIGDNWYQWNIENYGCKWDCTGELNHEEETKLEYYFDSPWSPPIEWLVKTSAKFPKLCFTLNYDEPGMGFKGEARAKGSTIENNCHDYGPEDYEHDEDCDCQICIDKTIKQHAIAITKKELKK